MLWSQLNDNERYEIYHRRYLSEEPETIAALAKELGMNPLTLNRRLQEMNKIANQADAGELPAQERSQRFTVKVDDDNHITLNAVSERITNLEELIRACKIDTKYWAIESWDARTYEMPRKQVIRDIRWGDSGKIEDGSFLKDNGGFTVATLYRISAKLVRKNPVAINPVVQPVTLPAGVSWKMRQLYHGDEIKSTLIIPDIQMGFIQDPESGQLLPMHDRQALDIVLQKISDTELHNIVLLGDALDFTDWSDKFIVSPDFRQVTQPAIEELAWYLRQIRELAPEASIHYIEGNHEKRLRDAIIKHVPQAYGLRPAGLNLDFAAWSLPNLLDLRSLGIVWHGDYPDGVVWLEDDLCVVHGMELSAEKLVAHSDVSIIFGHIHRADMATRAIYTSSGSRNIYAYSPGFLGRMDGSVPGTKKNQKWSQGFAMVHHGSEVDPQIDHISIRDGVAADGPTIYRGNDYRNVLIEEVPGKWRF